MKCFYSTITILILFNSPVNASFDNNLRQDSAIQINKIEFSHNHTGFITFNDLLINYYFKLIFEPNGKVSLTWPFKCPVKIGGKKIICAYIGNISKKKFNELARYLKRVDFINLKDRYTQDMDDVGYDKYLIKYNGIEKEIFDENYEVAILKNLKKRIIKI